MKKFFLITLIALTIITLSLFLVENTFAAGGSTSLSGVSPIKGISGESGIATLIGRVIKAALGLVGAFALLMFVYGGFLMLASGGKGDQINKGKEVLIWAVIGLIVILGSYTLTDAVIRAITSGGTTGGGKEGGETTTTEQTDCKDAHTGSYKCVASGESCPENYTEDNEIFKCDGATDKTCCYFERTATSCIEADSGCNAACCKTSCDEGECLKANLCPQGSNYDCCVPCGD